MLKTLVYAVNCDQFGKLVSLEKCLVCGYYFGKKSQYMECTFNKEEYKNKITEQYKNFKGIDNVNE